MVVPFSQSDAHRCCSATSATEASILFQLPAAHLLGLHLATSAEPPAALQSLLCSFVATCQSSDNDIEQVFHEHLIVQVMDVDLFMVSFRLSVCLVCVFVCGKAQARSNRLKAVKWLIQKLIDFRSS